MPQQYGQLDFDGFIQGEDGWRFPAARAWKLVQLCQFPGIFSAASAWQWREVLARRIEIFAASEIYYTHGFLPTKLSLYPELIPLKFNYPAQSPARLVCEQMASSLPLGGAIDLAAELRASPDRFSYFAPEGADLTPAGALAAGRGVLRHIADCAKLPMYRGATETAPPADVQRITENSLFRMSEQILSHGGMFRGTVSVWQAPSPLYDATLVIFGGPKFSNGTPSMLDEIVAAFRTTHLICSNDMDYSYCARVDADIVLSLVSEDELGQLPDDRYHVSIDEFWFSALLNRNDDPR